MPLRQYWASSPILTSASRFPLGLEGHKWVAPPPDFSGVLIRVPATSANLGPGFDVMGLALQLYNWIGLETADEASRGSVEVIVHGEGEDDLPRNETNRVVGAAQKLASLRGASVRGLRFTCWNNIPPGRGLGSSAAAVVGGLMAAHHWFETCGTPGGRGGQRMKSLDKHTETAILKLASALEGHADNAAAAIYGGLSITATVDGRPVARRIDAFKFPDVLMVIPPFSVSTEEARGKLPGQVPLQDAVFNLSRLVFLLTSLSHGDGLLPWHTQDRLHQPYRASLLPGAQEVLSAVIPAGAPGACVSGAGSSILIFLPNRRESQRRVVKAADRAMPGARLLVTRVSTKGAEAVAERRRPPDPSFRRL